MPVWADADFQSAIENGTIGAISIDTSVFDGSDCNLTYKLFTSLHQFSGTGIVFLLSDVVCGEVKSHISKRAEAAAIQLRAAAREFREAWRVGDAVENIMGVVGEALDHRGASERQLETYREETDFQILKSSELLDVDLLIEQYFSPLAPFEANPEKKSEFPDAIALNSLEAWGEKSQSFIVVVSKDKGWANFASESKWLVVRGDLRKTLGAFNAEDSFFAKSVMAKVKNEQADELLEEINTHIYHFVDGLSPHISAESGYYYESEFIGAELIDIHPIGIEHVAAVDSSEKEILISFDVLVDVEVEASFTFYVHDEGDSVPFSSSEGRCTITIKLPFTAAVARDIDNLSVIDIEIEASSSPGVDFGYVEPDYGDSDYDEYELGGE